MILTLDRFPTTDVSTLGELYVDDKFECFTCEDSVRETPRPKDATLGELEAWVATWKIAKRTAIPSGIYFIDLTESPRFNKPLPILLDVPGFTGVRIHPGNSAEDTEGCILVGAMRDQHVVLNSQLAFARLMKKIAEAHEKKEPIHIEIQTPVDVEVKG